MLLRVPQESMGFGTCLFGRMCSWLQLIINRDEMQKNTANKETQIPSKKRKSKVQDAGKAFVHLQSFIMLFCKHHSKISVFKQGGCHSLVFMLIPQQG